MHLWQQKLRTHQSRFKYIEHVIEARALRRPLYCTSQSSLPPCSKKSNGIKKSQNLEWEFRSKPYPFDNKALGGFKNMYNLAKFLCTSLCALSFIHLHADDPGFIPDHEISIAPHLESHEVAPFSSGETAHLEATSSADAHVAAFEPAAAHEVISKAPAPVKKAIKQTPVKPFTGKVKGKKVRLRLNADLDSAIVKEMNRGDFLVVVGEKGDFWAVEPPAGVKAYVFRSYVLDDMIEGSHVNVRLSPSTEAPVITHLNAGDKVRGGRICASNNKWMEIAVPASANFYIAKSYVENVGSPEVKAQHDSRRQAAQHLLETAEYLSKTEFTKGYPDIDFDKIANNYQSVIHEYSDFSDMVELAKEELAHVQETYIDKRLAYMESKPQALDEEVASLEKGSARIISVTDKMKLWEPVEESLYLSWSSINDNRAIEDFYSEQKLNATAVTGILEPYSSPVKCKPGDFIVKDKDLPVAYVYSTKVNLQELVGKKVTLMGTSRPNNNFAFPAYFVLSAE